MRTFATIFTGGGGADCGLREAGLAHLWGIEKRTEYAAIAGVNGFNTTVGDAAQVNWSHLERPDWLHASPPCQNASVANPGSGETGSGLGLAEAVCKAISELRPTVFSLENVRGYQRFLAFSEIVATLKSNGYFVIWQVLDSASYGVPQHRRRLWLVARREKYPALPCPSHGDPERQFSLLGQTQPYIGWGEALEGLPAPSEYELSPSMRQMLPESLSSVYLCTGWKNPNFARGLTMRSPEQPSPTLMAGMNRGRLLPHIISRNTLETGISQVLGVKHSAMLSLRQL